MKPAEDPIILAMRDVAKQITALRDGHKETVLGLEEEIGDLRAELEQLNMELDEARPAAERYKALLERVCDHDRGMITFEELMQEVGRG